MASPFATAASQQPSLRHGGYVRFLLAENMVPTLTEQ